MGRIEQLEKELDFLKEKYRNYFLILFALLTGEATIIYAVVSGDKPLYTLFLTIFGFILIVLVAMKIKNIEDATYEKLNALKEVE